MIARHIALAASLLLAATAQAGPVNLIVNGGFETTPSTVSNGTWTNFSSLSGWSVTAGPGSGIEVRNNVAGTAHGGNNFIELDTNGNTTIAQVLNGLQAGTSYTLDFWYSPRVGVGAASNGIDVFWNGVLLDSMTGTGGNVNAWSQHIYTVTALTGQNRLSFAATGTSDSLGGNLDDVSLLSVAADTAGAKVPEPGSLALVALALGAVALRRRQARG